MRTLINVMIIALLCAALVQGKEVKIGVILPLTGALADVGQDTRDAMILYMENHPEAAKEIGLIFEDDQSMPKYAAASAQKLMNLDKVDALVSWYGYGGHAVAPLAEAKKIIHMGLTLDRDVAKWPYSYANEPSPEEAAKTMTEAVVGLGCKKVSVVLLRSQGPLKLLGALEAALKEKGVQVGSISVLAEERDLRPVIMKLEEQKSDLWIAINYPPQADIFLRQCKEMQVKTPITSLWSFDYVQEKKLIEGRWYVRAALPSEEFSKHFKARFGHEIMPIAIYGYDGIKFLAEAFLAGKGDSVAAKKYLDNLKTAEGEGGNYTVDKDGFFDSPMILAKVENGKIRKATLAEVLEKKK